MNDEDRNAIMQAAMDRMHTDFKDMEASVTSERVDNITVFSLAVKKDEWIAASFAISDVEWKNVQSEHKHFELFREYIRLAILDLTSYLRDAA